MSNANLGDAGSSATYSQRNAARASSLVDKAFPRCRFGRSVFTTPLLLLFRLFYQATSFDNYHLPPPAVSAPRVTIWKLCRKAFSVLSARHSADRSRSLVKPKMGGVVDLASKTSTDVWHLLLQSKHYAVRPTSTLRSMTWVKSLSAPLSHEYLQWVIECNESGKHYRLIAERDTDGDWAYCIASCGNCDISATSNKVTQLRSYDYQHDLPLPLVSLSWARIPPQRRPTVAQLATILAQTSQLCPEYNVMREHCWWYAEAVFEQMFKTSANKLVCTVPESSEHVRPDLKHWPSGAYRYSYILLGKRVLRRDVLVQQAKSFQEEMDRDGQLRW